VLKNLISAALAVRKNELDTNWQFCLYGAGTAVNATLPAAAVYAYCMLMLLSSFKHTRYDTLNDVGYY